MEQYNAHEKAAIITKRLLDGEVLTVPQVAKLFDMSHDGAYKLMVSISRVLPVIDEFEATHVKDMHTPPPHANPGSFAPRRWRVCDYGVPPESIRK